MEWSPVLSPGLQPDQLMALLQAENRILELATRNTSLETLLSYLATTADELAGRDVRCSILLLDDTGRHLLHGAAPHLPERYNKAIHGIAIGEGIGSCGTAAATGQEVIVSDIATHPYWADLKELALGFGLRACWSTPFFSSKGDPLGTFAMYYSQPSDPDRNAQEVVRLISRTAALVLERARLDRELNEKIEQHKRTEKALRASQQSFARAQRAANIGSWTWDVPSGRLEFVNVVPTLEGFSGNLEDWIAHMLPDDLPHVRRELDRATREGGEFTIDFRLRLRPDGPVRWMMSAGWVDLEDGRATTGAGVMMDVTSQRQAEADRNLAEERFRLVLESSDIGFWYCDLPFSDLIWDAKVKEHFWFPPSKIVSIDDFYSRLHPDDRERTRKAIEASNSENRHYDIDYRTVEPHTGEVKWIRAVGRTTYDVAGNPIRFDGITIDFTERRRAEDALRASEKLAATGRLAATIAHEINNPLEAVTNFIYLAKNSDGLPPDASQYLQVADRELARVSHIAQQTLGFYRDTSFPTTVDVAALLDDVLMIYERKLEYKAIQVTREYNRGLTMHGLPGELRQVFSNLLANAIDACPEEATIRVRAGWRKGPQGQAELHILLADAGCGMPKDVQKRLFTPFFTTKQEVGTGLGLWVSRGIIEKHQGRLGFKSSIGNRNGTVFRIALPAVSQGAARNDG